MLPISLPRQSLGFFPTPLIELPRLSKALGGPLILMKRDDLTGLALGGNKTRKLEFILGEALAQGADCIITAGAEQSNHCRQTAAAAAQLGLECHLVLGGEAPAEAQGNLLLNELLGAHIHWAGEHRKGEDIPELAAQLKAAGKKPFLVPYGGSNELGAAAFVEALCELKQQLDALKKSLGHIVFASSSGGTHAGLMVAKKLLDWDVELIGIKIDKQELEGQGFEQMVLELARSTATLLGVDAEFSLSDVQLNADYLGGGYGVVGEAERKAIRLTAQQEGILLDPVYTGRAMAGLMGMIRKGQIGVDKSVLFWHTGGAPALFAYGAGIINN
ncbi:MAG: D-cysteine desulfhydrase family protein [Pseudomonadales bacterium]